MSRAALGLLLPGSSLFQFALLTACQEAPVRPELVLYVDVDMPVSPEPGVSPDAVVDSLRIEVYADDDATPFDARSFSINSPTALPLSFGIRGEASASGKVRVRIRAFRAGFATPGKLKGLPVLDPPPEVSIDRMVTLELPSEGVVSRSVVLRGDCMGILSHSGIGDGPDTSCIDGAHVAEPTTEGVADGSLAQTVSGSWAKARIVGCGDGKAPPGAVCVPGGFAIMGDPLFLAINELERDSLPLRPMTLAPFFMDSTEVTVGELRDLITAGYGGPLPMAPDPLDELDKFCSWSPDTDPSFALNCLLVQVADDVCEARGGRVPSEAQWEYAARGRGRRDIFVWADATAECCTANVGYFPGGGCAPEGPEPVASHPDRDACAGDVTADGIYDLNGGMAELVRDSVASFADDCWASNTESEILTDPVCTFAVSRVARGGSWAGTLGQAALPVRRSYAERDDAHGFRCVYEVASE